MSAYLNLVLNKKVVATMKVGDETDNAGEQAEHIISGLHHLVELGEERYEIIDPAAPGGITRRAVGADGRAAAGLFHNFERPIEMRIQKGLAALPVRFLGVYPKPGAHRI